MYKKWLVGFLFCVVTITSLIVKAQQRQPNGMILCECCGQPDCKCCGTEPPKRPPVQRIAECGFGRPIRVATVSNNRPFGWAEWVQGGATSYLVSKGYGVDVFEELAKKLQLRYQVFGYATDQEAINELKKGNVDLLIGVYTPEATIGRGASTIFPAFFLNTFSVFYRKDRAFDVQGLSSLNNKKGVIRRAENLYPLFFRRITDDMDISVDTTEGAFKKLLTGEIDYLIGSPYSIEAELRRYKLHNVIVSSSKQIFSAAMFMALTQATDCFKLRNILSDALSEYMKDPLRADKEVRKVIDAWGERFRDVPGMEIPDELKDEISKN